MKFVVRMWRILQPTKYSRTYVFGVCHLKQIEYGSITLIQFINI